MSAPWVLCAAGCGLHHREGDAKPLHSAAWLDAERVRLLAQVVNVRVSTLVVMAEGIDARERELRRRFEAAVSRGERQGIIDDLESRWCETFEARALVASISNADGESGIIGRHWIRPSPLVANRPRNAVTSAEPPPDELAAARERRDGTPISLDARADASGIFLDVDLGKPPEPRKT